MVESSAAVLEATGMDLGSSSTTVSFEVLKIFVFLIGEFRMMNGIQFVGLF